MWLVLDPSDESALTIRVLESSGRVAFERTTRIRYYRSQQVLPLIVAVSRLAHISIDRFSGILVVNGVGSFTTLRVVIATANTLGWLYGLPVCSISSDVQGSRLIEKRGIYGSRLLAAGFLGGSSRRFRKFLKPIYSGEPNIVKK